MNKIVSIFLFLALFIPNIFELVNHHHEICSEDGIHYHENVHECDYCLHTGLNFSTYLNFQSNYYFEITNENIISYELVHFNKISYSEIFGRAPPVKI